MTKSYYEEMEDLLHADPWDAYLKEEAQLREDDKYFYLASPYTKYPYGRRAAHDNICKYTAWLLEHGVFVFSPIVNSHHVCEYVSKENMLSHDFWLNVDFKYIKNSRGLIVVKMEGWQDSFGIGEEIKYANELGLPVIYTNFMELPKI